MGELLQAFEHIAPDLKHSLVLVGSVLRLFFGIHYRLIESGVIPPETVIWMPRGNGMDTSHLTNGIAMCQSGECYQPRKRKGEGPP